MEGSHKVFLLEVEIIEKAKTENKQQQGGNIFVISSRFQEKNIGISFYTNTPLTSTVLKSNSSV